MTNDSMGLHWARSADAETLASELTRTLVRPVADPFVQPLVLVPGAGIERWLSQRIATATPQGIRAGLLFARPAALGDLLAGSDPTDDPWSAERLVWAILALAAQAPADLAPLVTNLDASPQRVANAGRVARLIARYVRHRPDLLTQWTAGEGDEALGFDVWQAALWRHLHDVVAGPDPLERRQSLLRGLTDGSVTVPWPSVSLFMPFHLTRSDADLLAALASSVRVEVFTTFPAGDLASSLAARLGGRGAETEALLRSVATDVRDLDAAASDPLVEVHASHGSDRQVEVLREVLTGLFADDATLEPRDVVVACPDIGELTPHLQAAFASPEHLDGWRHPGMTLRVQVSDRAASEANRLYPLLRTVAELAQSRATASDLLTLAAHPFVARRFGLGAEHLDRLADLVPKASVRWGLNAAHRARFGLDTVRQGTWQVGVQRLLLGETLSDDTLAALGVIGTVDDIESTDVPLLGALAELVTRASRIATACLEPGTPSVWVERFRQVIDTLTDVPFEESWHVAQTWAILDTIERRSRGAGAVLGIADALALLDAEFSSLSERPAYGNGSLVVAPLKEVARIPHRVVCLVGLDERTFPRRGIGDGDDLVRDHSRSGDPDAGADDRQHLLDAVGAARERLVVIYRGHSSLTHEEHPPPSGVVDLIEATDAAIIHEALHPFSPAYFTEGPRSFDRRALAAATALVGPRVEPPEPFDVGHLPLSEPPTSLEVSALQQFLAHPAKYFLRVRAQLTIGDDEPIIDDLPLELDSLARWKIGDRVLDGALRGHPLDRVVDQEWRRGELPPGRLGERVLNGVTHTVSGVLAARQPWAEVAPEFHVIDLDLAGLRLTGRAATRGDVTLACEFGNVSPKHLASAWVDALALTVSLGRRVDAVVLGGRRRHRLAAPEPDAAVTLLARLCDLAIEGQTRVLPLPPRVGRLWAQVRATGHDPLADRRLATHWSYDQDATWRQFFDRGAKPWLPRTAGEPWAHPPEPTQLGSLAAHVWGPIVRAEV